MEPQICLGRPRQGRRGFGCMNIVIAIFAIAFAFVLGLLIGAVTGIVAFLGIGAVIVLLTILGLITLVGIIYDLCRQTGRQNC